MNTQTQTKKTFVCDSEGNKFVVEKFTFSLEGVLNGFYLKGVDGRGDKEISLHDAKFYKEL